MTICFFDSARKFTNCILIPQRYLLGIMTSLAIFISYAMRIALNLSITEMVIIHNETDISADACSVEKIHSNKSITDSKLLYDWSSTIQGVILSSFYWTYIITHIPGGLLAEKIGGKHVLGLGMFINSLVTLATPGIIITTGGNWRIVVVLRLLMGLGQGVVYPVCTNLLAQWVPLQERNTLSTVTYAGALLGTILANSIGGVIIQKTNDWSGVFYLFGGLGLMWNLAWQVFCYSFPRTHPCLKDDEKQYLLEQQAADISDKPLQTPWRSIFTSIPVWALVLAQFGHDWGWYVMITDLPSYMKHILRFDVMENGFYLAFPYILMWVASIMCGYLADWLITKEHVKVKVVRMVFATIATMGPAICMVAAAYVGCERAWAVFMFSMSLFFMGFYFAGIKINALDLAPNFAGTIMGLVNGLGVFAGMAAPALVGVITQDNTEAEWKLVFWLAFGIFFVTNVIYLVFMSAEVQPWNKPGNVEEEPDGRKEN